MAAQYLGSGDHFFISSLFYLSCLWFRIGLPKHKGVFFFFNLVFIFLIVIYFIFIFFNWFFSSILSLIFLFHLISISNLVLILLIVVFLILFLIEFFCQFHPSIFYFKLLICQIWFLFFYYYFLFWILFYRIFCFISSLNEDFTLCFFKVFLYGLVSGSWPRSRILKISTGWL
jgi:hypothetical protein